MKNACQAFRQTGIPSLGSPSYGEGGARGSNFKSAGARTGLEKKT